MKKKYDLAVCYRIYPKISKIPPIFAENKYKLSKLALQSFIESLGNLKVKFWVLLDGCPNSYADLFKRNIPEEDLNLIHLDSVGNAETFKKQIEILESQNDAELIYFAEDDYFYFPNQFPEMMNLIDGNSDVDFVSPYDHLDYYELDFHKYKSEIKFFGSKHWRTVSTTCMTFLTTKTKLKKAKRIFISYCKGNYDASLWLSITKINLFKPSLYFKFLFGNLPFFKIYLKCWLYSPIRNLFGKKFKLFVPMPTIATHLDSEHLAPGFNWEKILKRRK